MIPEEQLGARVRTSGEGTAECNLHLGREAQLSSKATQSHVEIIIDI